MFLISFYLMIISILMFFFSIYFMLLNIKLMIQWLFINMMTIKIELTFYLDWMTLNFISIIFLISSIVLIYSLEYMFNHINIKRFMYLIIIFFLSMMMMVLSPNMFSILLGWDGLGLSSYCLIIFYQNKKSFNCGMITILMNRMGDINILIMISFLINFNNLNFLFIMNSNNYMMIFIFITAFTKSAQIPFSIWLPMAMAAPTPVSSLVHSSTLVTAGVYMFIRINYLMSKFILMMISIISLWTMISASFSAMFEFDLKKIIALSTLSQLGLMFLTISMNLLNFSFFHLVSHAMFKSLLFLCSGIIIHNYFNNQDIRFISFSNLNFPSISMIFNTASLTLCGMPFLSGFYSKDLIIELFIFNNMNFFVFNFMYISMMLTLMYSIRLIFYISLKPMKKFYFINFNMNNYMNKSIYLLFLMSINYGTLMNWFMFNNLNLIILTINLKLLIFKLLLISMILMIFMKFKLMLTKFNIYLNYFFSSMWMFNNFFKNNKFNLFLNNYFMMSMMDSLWIEYFTIKKILFLIKFINLKLYNFLNFFMMLTLILYLILFNMYM